MSWKHTILITVLVGASCQTVTSQNADMAKSAPPIIEYPHYKRPNLVVADLERALTIYRDILGFEAANITESSADSFSYPVFNFPREGKLRSTYLSEPGEARIFGVTEVQGADLGIIPNTPHRTAHVIGITDLAGIIEKVSALGLETTESKVASSAEFTFIEQAFVDYDGHLIVLYEVLPE